MIKMKSNTVSSSEMIKENKSKLGAKNVTAVVYTKNGYTTTLFNCLLSVLDQRNSYGYLYEVIIIDDNNVDDYVDLRTLKNYETIFYLFDTHGIKWKVINTRNSGKVVSQNIALSECKTEWIWRIEDNNIVFYSSLAMFIQFMNSCTDKVGAVGGRIITKDFRSQSLSKLASSKIENINVNLNRQYIKNMLVEESDYLTDTFFYNVNAAKEIGGFCKDLKSDYREDIIFTFELNRKGYKNIIIPSINSYKFDKVDNVTKALENDNKVFNDIMIKYNVKTKPIKWVVLNNGMGDHYMFRQILNEFMNKYNDHRIIIACVYKEAFKNIKGIEVIDISEAKIFFDDFYDFDVYLYAKERNLKTHLINVYKLMYLGDNNENTY